MFNNSLKMLKFILFSSNGFLSNPTSTGKSMEIMMRPNRCCNKTDKPSPEGKGKEIIYCC